MHSFPFFSSLTTLAFRITRDPRRINIDRTEKSFILSTANNLLIKVALFTRLRKFELWEKFLVGVGYLFSCGCAAKDRILSFRSAVGVLGGFVVENEKGRNGVGGID